MVGCAVGSAVGGGVGSGVASGAPGNFCSVSQGRYLWFRRVLRMVSNAVAFRAWSIPSVVLVDLLDLVGILAG